jgi:Transposase
VGLLVPGKDVRMSGKRRKYTPEFREQAARLVIETGRPVAHVAACSSVWCRFDCSTTSWGRRRDAGVESCWAGPLYAWPVGWAGERAGAADGEAAVDPE